MKRETFETLEEAYDWVLQMGGHLALNFDGVYDKAFINDYEFNLVWADHGLRRKGYEWLKKGKYKP